MLAINSTLQGYGISLTMHRGLPSHSNSEGICSDAPLEVICSSMCWSHRMDLLTRLPMHPISDAKTERPTYVPLLIVHVHQQTTKM